MSLSPVGDLGIALKADVDDYNKAMASAGDITSGLTGTIRGLSATVRNLGVAMTGASALTGAALFTLSQRAERVNAAFREVDTLVQGASNAQERYGELTSDLNTEMGLQADRLEVIEGLYQSVSAGIGQSTEAQREFLTTASKLAVVGRVELGTSVDVLSTVMNTYGLEADQAQDVSESLFQTVQFGKTRMEDLAPVLGRVAALGSNLSIQIDEIGAAMGVLTRTGFGARVAATGLRNIFRAMMRPSETMQEQLRAIALEQDLFADSMEESEQQVRQLANEYRNASSAVQELTEKQEAARSTQEEASLAIQEARLKIEAIEEERLNQLPQLTTETVANANSVKELESIINDYQFQVNKARVAEENARIEREEKKSQLQDIRDEFKNTVDVQGDLKGGIGNLVLQNQDFVDTLVQLRERTEEQNIAFNELFPRTRALQGALALVGDDGEALTNIFEQMEEGTFDAAESWSKLDESAKENFESFQEFQNVTEEVTSGDLNSWFKQAQGPQQQLRNSISKLQESLASLGRVFTEDLVDTISTFAENVNNLTERFASMEESVRENISEFTILAVTLGLVLGPLLLFGGQIALIAQAMGSMFIPFALLSGSAIGILGGALSNAASGGQEAQTMFEEMRSFLASLIGVANHLRNVFVEEVLPGMIVAGEGVVAVFAAVFNEVNQSVGGSGSLIRQFGSVIGNIFRAIGNILKNNAQAIGDFAGVVASAFVNVIIPAIQRFASIAVNDVFPQLVTTFRSDVIPAVTALWDSFETTILPFIVNTLTNQIIPAVVSLSNTFFNRVIPSISAFIQGNSDAIVKGGTFAAVLIGLSKALGAVVSFVGPIVAKIIAFGSRVVAAGRKVVGLTRFVRSANTALLGMQRASFAARLGISALGGPIGIIINLLATLAALWIADVGGMRSALAPLVDGVTHFGNQMTDEVAPAIISLVTNIVKLGEEITALVTSFLGAGDGIVALEVAMRALRIIIEGLGDAILGIVQAVNAVILGLRSLVAFLSGDFQKSARLGKKAIQLMFQGIINIVIGLGQALVGLFRGIIATIVGLVLDLINGILEPFRILYRKLVGNSIIPDMLDDIVNAFANLPQRVAKALVNLGSVIVDAIPTSLEDLANLGNALAKLGSAMGDAIIAGFNLAKKLGPKLIDALQYLIEDTIDSTTDVASKLAKLGSEFAKAISNGVSNIFDGLSGLLDISPSDALDWGRTLIEKIAEGIGKAGKIIKDAIKNAAGKLGKFLPSSPADEGPLSKPNHPEARGEALATDVAKGIEGSESKFEDAVRSFTDTELENISGDVGFDLASMKSKIQEQNIGKGMNTNANQKLSQSSSENKDKKIEVSEKAIYFEEGAFQGVSDEELPMKVREVFDESMRDIVQEIDGAGKQRTN